MSQFSSTLEVLALENEERTSARTGKQYQHFAARCVLRADDGAVVTVGTLRSRRITPELRDQIKPGLFRAGFTMQVPDFGDDKGDITCVLTSLTPVPASTRAAAPSMAK